MRTAWWRLLGSGLVLAEVGLPITDLADFSVFSGAFLVILFSTGPPLGRTPRRRALALAAVALTVIGGKLVLPRAAIEEGQGVFAPREARAYAGVLPPEVLEHLEGAFARRFPRANQCAATASPCWLDLLSSPPPGGYGFSSESLVRPARYSRVVDAIRFGRRETLPLAALNDLRYNFHPPFSPTRVRLELPYFVLWELPARLAGGRLCWRGDLFWERSDGTFEHLPHRERACTALAGDNLGRRVFAVETLPEAPLAVRLDPPGWLAAAALARRALAYAGVALTVITLCGWRWWRGAGLPLAALAATVLWGLLLEPLSYTGFRLHPGGSDGLGYESFARDMAAAAAAGDWREAFKGVEPIYWSMPGLRYFLAALKPVFADTFFGYLLACALLPVVIHRLLRTLLSARAAAVLIGLFLLTPLLEYFRFTQFIYVKLVVDKGHAETLGYLLFLCALVLTLTRLEAAPAGGRFRLTPPLGSGTAFLIGLCGFAAVAVRPNLAPSVGLLLALVAVMTLVARDLPRVALLGLGFAPIGLLALHNYVYGGHPYLLTMTGTHPANLEMPPAVYVRALGQLLTLDLQGSEWRRMLEHLHTWNHPSEFYRVIAFLVVVWVACARRQPPRLRLVSWMALSQQAVLLFYHASGRYAFLAWLLTFVVFAVVLVERFVPWLRTRFASTSGRAATAGGRASVD